MIAQYKRAFSSISDTAHSHSVVFVKYSDKWLEDWPLKRATNVGRERIFTKK